MPKIQSPPRKYSRTWLTDLDGRTEVAKQMRERFKAFTNDLGGAERLSYAQRSLVERVLWLEYWLATQERELASGKEFDVARWVQAANSLQGIMSKLGLERVAREIPSLREYIRR